MNEREVVAAIKAEEVMRSGNGNDKEITHVFNEALKELSQHPNWVSAVNKDIHAAGLLPGLTIERAEYNSGIGDLVEKRSNGSSLKEYADGSKMRYDSHNKPIAMDTPQGDRWNFSYDANNNLVGLDNKYSVGDRLGHYGFASHDGGKTWQTSGGMKLPDNTSFEIEKWGVVCHQKFGNGETQETRNYRDGRYMASASFPYPGRQAEWKDGDQDHVLGNVVSSVMRTSPDGKDEYVLTTFDPKSRQLQSQTVNGDVFLRQYQGH